MTVERFLATLPPLERSFLLARDIEREITPAGLAQAVVWFAQNTCSPDILRYLFPGVPVVQPRRGLLGAAMVDDLAHLLIPYASVNGRTVGHVTTETRSCALMGGPQAPAPAGTTVADPSYASDPVSGCYGRFVYDELCGQVLLRTTKKGLPCFLWYGAQTHESHSSSLTILIGEGPARGRVAHQVTVQDTRVRGALPPPPLVAPPVDAGAPGAKRRKGRDGEEAQSTTGGGATAARPPSYADTTAVAAITAPPDGAARREVTSVIDFSGFAASLSATLTGVYSHHVGGTINGTTYTSRQGQYGHFLVVPAASVLQPARGAARARRSEMGALEVAFASVALGSSPLLRDSTRFGVEGEGPLLLAAGAHSGGGGDGVGGLGGGGAAAGGERGMAAGGERSVTTLKAPSYGGGGEASESADAATGSSKGAPSSGADGASSAPSDDEDGAFFEQPSAEAVAAFSHMFAMGQPPVV